MRIRNIAWNYLTHWFVADLSMIVIDAVSLFAMEDDALEALTLLRLLRNIRLLRLLKMSDRFTLLREIFSSLEYELEWTSVYLATFMGIVQHLGVIALLCHFTGCAWYGLGGMTSTDATWVKEHAELRGSYFDGGSVIYWYSTSVHWSLTQFTPAAMDVVATNTPERIFSVIICLGGLIAFSFFLGTINQSFAKLRSLTAQETRQRKLVRRYVADKHVSADLSSEILACIRQRGLGKAMGKIVFSDIKAFENLPHKLLRRLQEEVGIPVLEKHGMFKYLTYLSISDVARTCHSALTEQSIVYGEEVFQAGAVSMGMCLGSTSQAARVQLPACLSISGADPDCYPIEVSPHVWSPGIHLGGRHPEVMLIAAYMYVQEAVTSITNRCLMLLSYEPCFQLSRESFVTACRGGTPHPRGCPAGAACKRLQLQWLQAKNIKLCGEKMQQSPTPRICSSYIRSGM